MRGYAVHLLFHLLAIVCGVACGVPTALWWFGRAPWGMWLAAGSLAVGVVLLVLQGLYLSGSQPAPPRPRAMAPPARRREPTRPDLEPVAAPGTLRQPRVDPDRLDEETTTTAAAALDEQWRNPTTRQN
ncbi:hypothetical protein GCM10011581_11930 [Saccharopolyspora subtropica]|uniref:Uncharacterized protein n=1 Tax=Saccharopolyspora thermophila TaxID=89367 RepID=A0A917N9Z7_9PSEU|nr:hypothetical protein [Saccharopolyspora subtropica]GGI76425.1 hypothetical protein GCM10011581_11930 [Saccharopolyspora subtropica]